MAALYLLILLALALVVWLTCRLLICIIKTAIKEALREYDQEKWTNGPQEY